MTHRDLFQYPTPLFTPGMKWAVGCTLALIAASIGVALS